MNIIETDFKAQRRAETVLRRHGVRDECFTQNERPRSRRAIDAIIADIRAVNAAAAEAADADHD